MVKIWIFISKEIVDVVFDEVYLRENLYLIQTSIEETVSK